MLAALYRLSVLAGMSLRQQGGVNEEEHHLDPREAHADLKRSTRKDRRAKVYIHPQPPRNGLATPTTGQTIQHNSCSSNGSSDVSRPIGQRHVVKLVSPELSQKPGLPQTPPPLHSSARPFPEQLLLLRNDLIQPALGSVLLSLVLRCPQPHHRPLQHEAMAHH